jgi:hypothetical protein
MKIFFYKIFIGLLFLFLSSCALSPEPYTKNVSIAYPANETFLVYEETYKTEDTDIQARDAVEKETRKEENTQHEPTITLIESDKSPNKIEENIKQIEQESYNSSNWEKIAITDRFGDPTGEISFRQIVSGTGQSSSQERSQQTVLIGYSPNTPTIGFLIKSNSLFSFPLNFFLLEPEKITLYIKDSKNQNYSFDGFQHDKIVEGEWMGIFFLSNEQDRLISLLRKSDSYKAVIEGDSWSCNFTFGGGLPK